MSNGKKNSAQERINEQIRAREVRLIDAEGNQAGIVARVDALRKAQDANLDLVEISPNAEPPVCRIMDYGKHIYDRDKKQQAARKKQKQTQVKEIKFRPGTDEGDYQVKLRNLIRFLQNGDKAKVTVRFRGREMAHQDLGIDLLNRVKEDLQEYGSVEQHPSREGRQLIMVVGPLKTK